MKEGSGPDGHNVSSGKERQSEFVNMTNKKGIHARRKAVNLPNSKLVSDMKRDRSRSSPREKILNSSTCKMASTSSPSASTPCVQQPEEIGLKKMSEVALTTNEVISQQEGTDGKGIDSSNVDTSKKINNIDKTREMDDENIDEIDKRANNNCDKPKENISVISAKADDDDCDSETDGTSEDDPNSDNKSAEAITNTKYLESDSGPYIVHLGEKARSDKTIEREIQDTIIGLKMKKLKVKGVMEVMKVNRRELKVIFKDKSSANDFLAGSMPQKLGVVAYIPKYNVSKVGLIFDIPTSFSEKQLMEEITSSVPIVEIYRCRKRKFLNGKRTDEWMDANTVKITFRCQSVPDEITFGYSKRKVKPDVPGVTQCFKCLRFGHVNKYCRQEESTCSHCGIQHVERPCQRAMKCFHCHSDKLGGTSKDCPEFLRNQLIKESMYFNNVTFFEANESFPRTESSYRLAEKQKEFPELVKKLNPMMKKERVEASFPRKTVQDLKRQYCDYVQLNKGKKPVADSRQDEQTYSQVASKSNEKVHDSTSKREGYCIEKGDGRQSTRKNKRNEDKDRNRRGDRAIELVQSLQFMMERAHTDQDQEYGSSITNDQTLLEIARMLMDFCYNKDREIVSYSDEEGEMPQNEDI